MKNYFSIRQLKKAFILLSICISLGFFGAFSAVKAKAAPLSLGDVLTGLRSKKTTLAQRNKLLTTAVKQRGITFALTGEIEKELKATGANSELLEAIRQMSPKPTQTPTQNGKPFGKLNAFQVDHNVYYGGKKGMMIRPHFTVYNLQNVATQFIVLVETENGNSIKALSREFASKTGNLIVGDFLDPRSNAANYNLRYFLPYDEINLGSGVHELRLNTNLIYNNGTRITQFDFYYFTFRVS